MAELIIVYWRDIPGQVIARAGRTAEKRALADRFGEAIDMCAMRVGARDSDAYLADWRRGEPTPVTGDLAEAADAAVARLEGAYDATALKALIDQGGYADARDAA